MLCSLDVQRAQEHLRSTASIKHTTQCCALALSSVKYVGSHAVNKGCLHYVYIYCWDYE